MPHILAGNQIRQLNIHTTYIEDSAYRLKYFYSKFQAGVRKYMGQN